MSLGWMIHKLQKAPRPMTIGALLCDCIWILYFFSLCIQRIFPSRDFIQQEVLKMNERIKITQILDASRSEFIFMFFKRKSIAFFIFKIRFTDFVNIIFVFFLSFFINYVVRVSEFNRIVITER